MKVHRTPWPLASWSFTWREREVLRYDASDVEMLATAAMLGLRALSEQRLLSPQKMMLDAWVAVGAAGKPARTDDGPAELDVPDLKSASLGPWVLRTLRDEFSRRGAYPLDVQFTGQGEVHDEEERVVTMPDVVRLSVPTMAFVSLEISTDIDVWLPYDLAAAPQPTRSALNMPRLQAALRGLAALDGISVGSSEVTDYAVASEDFDLRNHSDVRGDPTEVVDEGVETCIY